MLDAETGVDVVCCEARLWRQQDAASTHRRRAGWILPGRGPRGRTAPVNHVRHFHWNDLTSCDVFLMWTRL